MPRPPTLHEEVLFAGRGCSSKPIFRIDDALQLADTAGEKRRVGERLRQREGEQKGGFRGGGGELVTGRGRGVQGGFPPIGGGGLLHQEFVEWGLRGADCFGYAVVGAKLWWNRATMIFCTMARLFKLYGSLVVFLAPVRGGKPSRSTEKHPRTSVGEDLF